MRRNRRQCGRLRWRVSDISDAALEDALRDRRVRAVELSFQAGEYLREGAPLHAVMAKLRRDASAAMAEFATVNLGDALKLQDLQARVYRFTIARDTFDMLLQAGQEAWASIQSEDAVG